MSELKLTITDSDNAFIAKKLRKIADSYQAPPPAPRPVRWPIWAAFIGGMIMVAAMDYGDVWLCVGQCNAHIAQEE